MWRVGTHTVTIPLVASAGKFQVDTSLSPIGSVRQGQGQWFSIQLTGQQRLLQFQATIAAVPNINFTYPSQRAFSSLYKDDQLDVGESDFFAVYVNGKHGCPTQRLIGFLYSVGSRATT